MVKERKKERLDNKRDMGGNFKRVTLESEIDNTLGEESLPVTMMHYDRSSRKQPRLWRLGENNIVASI